MRRSIQVVYSLYWLALSCFSVCVSAIALDRRRVRELIPAGLAGVVLSGLHLVADVEHSPILPASNGPWDRVSITLLVQAIVAPAVALWFAQGFTGDRGYPVVRVLKFTGMCLSVEAMSLAAGQIHYAPTWNMGLSAVYYLAWFSTVWWIQTWVSTYVAPPVAHKAPPR